MNDSMIEDLLNERIEIDEEEQKKMNRKIRSGVARGVYMRIIAVLIGLMLAVSLGIGGYRYFREKRSFHLSDLEMIADEQSLREKGLDPAVVNAGYYLDSYYALFRPGKVIRWGMGKEERVDYGYYRLSGVPVNFFRTDPEDLADRFLSREYDGEYVYIRDGCLSDANYDEGYTAMRHDHFLTFWEGPDTYIYGYKNDAAEETEKLPESALIELDVKLKDPVSFPELFSLQTDHPDSRIIYVVTHLMSLESEYGSSDKAVMGFSMLWGLGGMAEPGKEAAAAYPALSYSLPQSEILIRTDLYIEHFQRWLQEPIYVNGTNMDLETYLKTRYMSQLRLLLNNHVLDGNLYERDKAQAVLKDLEENDMTVRGARIICTKNDALDILSDNNVSYAHIEDVKLTRFDN